MKTTDPPIVIEQSLNAPISRVWKAITNLDEMHKWYFDNIPAFEPNVGFEVNFSVKSETREFLHMWKVIEVIPNKLIKYNWKYPNYAGDSNVVFELFHENGNTLLKLSVEILEDFPDNIPEFKHESCVGGWEYFINNRLREYLESV